ncbi:efflux RND transporter periplasmic adaptor subunit [uncultured Paraglaciecola sp.]|uniref:efflux RND transporter periplasmic adaptor subunit n=1 Tax=uncultured Paraglaciecola sp. TaxID=1765024 RepID=UPI0025970BF6|nr:efflux RND transporter periplasmic adaptor subunit [uncultured Paraglaciecola sp.]
MPIRNFRSFYAFAAITASLFLVACNKDEPPKQPRPLTEVDVSTPISAVVDIWDDYTGRFEAVNYVEIRARVSGYLDQIKFEDGQQVKAGDVLFIIDQRPFKINLQSAQSNLDIAEKEYKRGLELQSNNSISQEESDRRVSEYQLAKAAFDNAKLDLEFTEVKSPIDGVVSRDLVNKGNLVTGGASGTTLLTTVVSVDPIHFYFEAGERDLLKYLRLAQSDNRKSSRVYPNEVKVRLQDEDSFSHFGVMDFVDNKVDDSTGTIQGRAIFDNKDGFILPGLFGRISLIETKNANVILVPDAIIGTDQSRKYVTVINGDNKVGRKYVTLGKLHTQELRIIKSGITSEDKLIVNGFARTRPGASVSPNVVDISKQFDL